MTTRRLLLAAFALPRLAQAGLALAPLAAPRPARARAPLRPPFDAEAIRARNRAGQSASCAAGLPPLRSLAGTRFYTDPAGSVVDPQAARADALASRPLVIWLQAIQGPLEAWLLGGPDDAAACALRVLDEWAAADALLGEFDFQGSFHRMLTACGAGLAFLALSRSPDAGPERTRSIGAWLRRIALAIRPEFDRVPRPDGRLRSQLNNHAYSAGVAAGVAAIAADDPDLLLWAIRQARIGLGQVAADGSLPQELMRRGLALHYHMHAFDQLAVLERLAASNGFALGAEERSALDRLQGFVMAGIADPARVAALAGETQRSITAAPPGAAQAYGLEIRQWARREASVEHLLAPVRPLRHRWLGGNVTLLFG